MKIEVTYPDGLPKVAWIQSTSESGHTRGTRRSGRFMIAGGIVGLLAGLAGKEWQGLIIWPLVGIFGGLALATRGQPGEKESRSDAAPVTVDQYCEAQIRRVGDDLRFSWSLKGRKMRDSFEIPLVDVSELFIGGMNEWFGNKGGLGFHEADVIVMTAGDGGVLRIAAHMGGRGHVARLHSVLTREIVDRRGPLLRDLQKARRMRSGGGDEVPESV